MGEGERHVLTSESSKSVDQRHQGSIPRRSIEQGSSLPSSHSIVDRLPSSIGMIRAGGGGQKGTIVRGEDDGIPLSKVGLVADVFASKPQRKRRPYRFMTKKGSITSSPDSANCNTGSATTMASVAQPTGGVEEAAALSSWDYAARAVKVFEGRLPESILGWTFLLPGDPPSFIEKTMSRRMMKEEQLPHQEDQSVSQQNTSLLHGGEKDDNVTGTFDQPEASAAEGLKTPKSQPDLSRNGGGVTEEEQRRRQGVDNDVHPAEEGMTRETNGRDDSAVALSKEESNKHPHTTSAMTLKKENTMLKPRRGVEREEMTSIRENKWRYSDVFELCLEAAICKDTLADK